MTSRYRVEYALKSHRRDEFIEWIKGLLAVPFVLHADVEIYDNDFSNDYNDKQYLAFLDDKEKVIQLECRNRYLEIFADIQHLVKRTIEQDKIEELSTGQLSNSRLRKLVPSLGRFYTSLPLTDAFLIEDERRSISKRRLVSPSFNDVRRILNTAQVLGLAEEYRDKTCSRKLKLLTFDGDVTLYEDGMSLVEDSPLVSRLVALLSMGFFVAVVTAAGYPGESGANKYKERLGGLIDALIKSKELTNTQKESLLIMGGESNYLFRYNDAKQNFDFINGEEWYLPTMNKWNKKTIEEIMNIMELHMSRLQLKFNLHPNTQLIKKERSVGIIPNADYKIPRELLEEIVLSCSSKLAELLHRTQSNKQVSASAHKFKFAANEEGDEESIKVCAFNGGADVWVDIGDKSLGVESLQKYLCRDEHLDMCPISKSESLHVGDQFASVGANDFKTRLSACTVWISSPKETQVILDDLIHHIKKP